MTAFGRSSEDRRLLWSLVALAIAAPSAELDRVLSLVLADQKVRTSTSALAVGDRIYELIFEPADAPVKAAMISEQVLRDRFLSYQRSMLAGAWMVRAGMSGQNEAKPIDTVRIYMNLLPDGTPEAVEQLTRALNDRKIRFTIKVASTLKEFSRSSTGVIYLARDDYDAARAIMIDVVKRVPSAFTDPITPFTKRIAKGISAADEPDPARVPKTRPQHSFGTLVADAIAEALLEAPRATTLEVLKQRVRKRFRVYGVDEPVR